MDTAEYPPNGNNFASITSIFDCGQDNNHRGKEFNTNFSYSDSTPSDPKKAARLIINETPFEKQGYTIQDTPIEIQIPGGLFPGLQKDF